MSPLKFPQETPEDWDTLSNMLEMENANPAHAFFREEAPASSTTAVGESEAWKRDTMVMRNLLHMHSDHDRRVEERVKRAIESRAAAILDMQKRGKKEGSMT